VQKLNLNAN